jgi:hypothetical protein
MSVNNMRSDVRTEVFMAGTMKNDVFWMLRRVALVRTDVSEVHIASISELGTMLAVTTRVILEVMSNNFL